MSEKKVLSVVIPMYKGKPFIRNTVEAVLKIKHSKQILIVDDGSPDDSLKYCVDLWGDKSEIQIMSKPNGGIVDARNYGLQHTIGTYTIFVDHDDIVVPEVIDTAIEKAEATDSELIMWSTSRLYDSGELIPCDTVYSAQIFDKEHIRKELLSDMLINQDNSHISYIGHVWASLYRTDFIKKHNICFKKFVDIEDDYLFVFDCLVHAEKVACIPEVGYYWRYNEKSETYRLKYIDNIIDRYQKLYQYIFSALYGVEELGDFKEQYILYIKQDVIVNSIENSFTCLNSSKLEKRRISKVVSQNKEAFKVDSVRPYTKRRKRIFLLINKGLPQIAFLYVYMDSVYRQFRKKMRG